jgi:hypothetical protein
MINASYFIPTDIDARFDFESTVIMLSKAYASEWAIPYEIIKELGYFRQTYELRYVHAVNRNFLCPLSNEALDYAWSSLEEQLIYLFDHYLINNDSIPNEYKAILYIQSQNN